MRSDASPLPHPVAPQNTFMSHFFPRIRRRPGRKTQTPDPVVSTPPITLEIGFEGIFLTAFELTEREPSLQLGLLRRSGCEGWTAGSVIPDGADKPDGGKN